MSTKPFDITKPVQTRTGLAVRLYATDGWKRYPIHGAVSISGEWRSETWSEHGLSHHGATSDRDLVNVTTKREGWVNVYQHNGAFTNRLIVGIYLTREAAIAAAEDHRIDTVRIEWEE